MPCLSIFLFLFPLLSHFVVLLAEQRQRLAADERRREYHEEQRNEFESYAEEEHDGENSNHSPGGHFGSGRISSVLRSFNAKSLKQTGLRLNLAEPCRVLRNRVTKSY